MSPHVSFPALFRMTEKKNKIKLTSLLIVIVRCIKLGIFIGQLDWSNKKVILFITGVSAKDEAMDAVILSLGSDTQNSISALPHHAIIHLLVKMTTEHTGYNPSCTLWHQGATVQWGMATPVHVSLPGHIGKVCSFSISCTLHWWHAPPLHHQMCLWHQG